MRGWYERCGFEALASVGTVVCVSAVAVLHFSQPKSLQGIAETLRAAQQPQEEVIFVGAYYYDLAFYAGLTRPVTVVDRWEPKELAKDSWRRELTDAAMFVAPTDRPRWPTPSDLPALLCRETVSWVVAPAGTQVEPMASDRPVQVAGQTALWHFRLVVMGGIAEAAHRGR